MTNIVSLWDDTGVQALQLDVGPSIGGSRSNRRLLVSYGIGVVTGVEVPVTDEPATDPETDGARGEAGGPGSDDSPSDPSTDDAATDTTAEADATSGSDDAPDAGEPADEADGTRASSDASDGDDESDESDEDDSADSDEDDVDDEDAGDSGEDETRDDGDEDDDDNDEDDDELVGEKRPDDSRGRRRRGRRRGRRGRRTESLEDAPPPELPIVPDPETRQLIGGAGEAWSRELLDFAASIRQLVDYSVHAITFRCDAVDFRIEMSRDVLIPNVRVRVIIDGNGYLPKSEIPGHLEVAFTFWTTVEALLSFSDGIRGAVRSSERSGRRRRANADETPATSTRVEVAARQSRSWAPVVDNPDEFAPHLFFWEYSEEVLKDENQRQREEDAWERKNDEWLASFEERERRRRKPRRTRGRKDGRDSEDDDDDDDADVEADADDSQEASSDDAVVAGALEEIGGDDDHEDLDELTDSDDEDLPVPEVVGDAEDDDISGVADAEPAEADGDGVTASADGDGASDGDDGASADAATVDQPADEVGSEDADAATDDEKTAGATAGTSGESSPE